MTLHSFAAQDPRPEPGQHQGFRTVDNNLVNPADHDVRLSPARARIDAISVGVRRGGLGAAARPR
jgi:hypothetical protein